MPELAPYLATVLCLSMLYLGVSAAVKVISRVEKVLNDWQDCIHSPAVLCSVSECPDSRSLVDGRHRGDTLHMLRDCKRLALKELSCRSFYI